MTSAEYRMANQLQKKLDQVQNELRALGRVAVAFSGGIDSTLLLALARQTLGRDAVLAVTADSASLAREDLEETQRLAVGLDVEHLVITTRETENSLYQANTPDRCYVCKQTLFIELEPLAAARGMIVVYGAIGDDAASERPGQQAAAEQRVRAPLQSAGIEKWEVREAARQMGLPNWDRPQNACLSSRIPHGLLVTEDKLRQIEQAETFLRAKGFHQVRVRHLGIQARVEVDPAAVARFNESALRSATEDYFHTLGFLSTIIDPRGYHPGGANQ